MTRGVAQIPCGQMSARQAWPGWLVEPEATGLPQADRPRCDSRR